jgi:hypothetical protein
MGRDSEDTMSNPCPKPKLPMLTNYFYRCQQCGATDAISELWQCATCQQMLCMGCIDHKTMNCKVGANSGLAVSAPKDCRNLGE